MTLKSLINKIYKVLFLNHMNDCAINITSRKYVQSNFLQNHKIASFVILQMYVNH